VNALDERIAAGMRDQLAVRDERLRGGARQIGWKVGFGSPAAAAALEIDRPLVGFLIDGGLVLDGATVPVAGWAVPMLEPEIAARMARDVVPGARWADVRDAIGGLSAAIELADVDPPPRDVRAILAGNIFHRNVMLGPVDRERRTAQGIAARVVIDGEQAAQTDDPAKLAGELVEVVRLTAELLEICGERLRAGEVVITGSVVPPLPVAPGQRVQVDLAPLGTLTVQLT